MPAHTTPLLNGWLTLPKELQLEILSHVVLLEPSRRGLLSAHWLGECRYWNNHSPFLGIVAPLLACKEIKPLVLEVFYTRNRFLLSFQGSHNRPSMVMQLPPQPIRKLIRRIHISLGIWTEDKIRLLTEAACATGKLENLTFLDISFGPNGTVKIEDVPELRFESKCLRVTFEHFMMRLSGGLSIDVLLDRFTLGATAERSETIWRRHVAVRGEAGYDIIEVDSWDENIDYKNGFKWTIKEIVTQGCRFTQDRLYAEEHLICIHRLPKIN